jgi:hypothetical protein
VRLVEPSDQIASRKGVDSVQCDTRVASESDPPSLGTDRNASERIIKAIEVNIGSPGAALD